MKYALIKDGIVEKVIVADEEYIATVVGDWDFCVRVDEIGAPHKWTKVGESDVFADPEDPTWDFVPAVNMPGVGWLYDGENFSAPEEV